MYNSCVPIMYEINRESGTIRTKCFGQVTMPEVIDHFRTLGEDPNCPSRLDVYLDVSDVTFLPESNQLSAVVTELKKFQRRTRFDACAIVATNDALFGMMRMFETLAEEYFRVSRIFRSGAEAEAWLAEQKTNASKSATEHG
jgi:hypothetical protein